MKEMKRRSRYDGIVETLISCPTVCLCLSCTSLQVFMAEWIHQPCDLMKDLKTWSSYYGIVETLIRLFTELPLCFCCLRMVFVDCGTITAVYPFWFFLLSHCSFYCRMESSTLWSNERVEEWSNERVEETKWVLWYCKNPNQVVLQNAPCAFDVWGWVLWIVVLLLWSMLFGFSLNQAGQIGCKSAKLCQQFQVSHILFSNPAQFYWSVSTILGNFCLHHW
jgi:hypothetical protein